jgi:protein-L-isoaspartate O-methyltransferase
MAILIVFTIILVAFAVFFVIQFFNIIFRGFAPFVSTKPEVLEKILNEIKLNQGDKVLELGCGKAGFLRAIEEKFPGSKLLGVEYSYWPWLITKIQLAISRSKIRLHKKNILKVPFGDSDLIYCYLNVKTMARLAHKLRSEGKKGATVVSYAFPILEFSPVKVIELTDKSKIYFYTL